MVRFHIAGHIFGALAAHVSPIKVNDIDLECRDLSVAHVDMK